MSVNATSGYDLDRYGAEWYDQHETYTDDIELIRRLIDGRGPLRVLEAFCGTGRILIPLAQDGHQITGLDRSKAMLDRARMKIDQMPEEARRRVSLIEGDVITNDWPQGFDLVILGGNCFYELATPEEQEHCIASASAALNPGGYLYLDNNHMEGELADDWREPGVRSGSVWTSPDGTRVQGSRETIWFDAPLKLWKSRQRKTVTLLDGTATEHEFIVQKHPVSVLEQQEWLVSHGFLILHLYGDRAGSTYTPESGRGIFWARKGAQ